MANYSDRVAYGVTAAGVETPLPIDANGKLDTSASLSGDVTIDATGLATETTLGTVHGHVDSIDTKTPALGQALAAASSPVVLPAAQDPVTVLGAVADAKVATDTTGSVSAKLRGVVALLVDVSSYVSRLLTSAFAAAGSGAAATTGFLIGAVYNATPPTITDGNQVPLQTDNHGALKVAGLTSGGLTDTELRATPVPVSGTVTANLSATDNAVLDTIDTSLDTLAGAVAGGHMQVDIISGAGSGGTAIADGDAFTPDTTNLTPVGGIYEATPTAVGDGEAGAAGMTAYRVMKVIPAAADGTAVTPVADPADDADFTAGSTVGSPIMGAYDDDATAVSDGDLGIVRVTSDRKLLVSSAVTSVVPGSAATNLGKAEDAAHTSGDVGVMSLAVRKDATGALAADGDYVPLQVGASGDLKVGGYGLVGGKNLDVDESEDEIKATAGRLAWVWFSNLHATDARYLKFYNATAANTTVGTTEPQHTFRLRGATDGTIEIPEGGLIFDTAISVAATTAMASNDTGAPGAGEVLINFGYK